MLQEYQREIEYFQTKFKLTGVLLPLANAIRRGLLSILPIVSFDDKDNDSLDVIENTTVLTDDFITHRLSLIPLDMNNKNLVVKTFFKPEEGIRVFDFKNISELPTLILKNNEEGDLDTTDFYIKGGDNNIPATAYFNQDLPITITKCNKDDRVIIECKPKIGIGRQNSRSCPVGTVAFRSEDNKSFHFSIESIGFLSADQLVVDVLEMLRLILSDIYSSIKISKRGEITFYPKVDLISKDGGYHFILKNENHTIGNLLSAYLQEFFHEDLQFVGYRVNHPLVEEVEIIILPIIEEKLKHLENNSLIKSLEIDKKILKGMSNEDLDKLFIISKFLEGIQKLRDLLENICKEYKKLSGIKTTSYYNDK